MTDEEEFQNKLESVSSNQLERLFFIEKLLRFTGSINRKDIVDGFGVKEAAATRDLALYRSFASDNTVYDSKSRSYMIASAFKGEFSTVFTNELMVKNGRSRQPSTAESIPHVSVGGFPKFDYPDTDDLATVTRSIATKRYLSIVYHSLSSPTRRRKIAPFVVLNNGFRWYARAFDTERGAFRDFVVNRMETPRIVDEEVQAQHAKENDDQWSRFVSLKIAAHNRRENIERPDTIEFEYGMDFEDIDEQGSEGSSSGQRVKTVTIKIRAALVGYLLRKWNVDCSEDHSLGGREFQLRLMNTATLYGVTNLGLAPGYKKPKY